MKEEFLNDPLGLKLPLYIPIDQLISCDFVALFMCGGVLSCLCFELVKLC